MTKDLVQYVFDDMLNKLMQRTIPEVEFYHNCTQIKKINGMSILNVVKDIKDYANRNLKNL